MRVPALPDPRLPDPGTGREPETNLLKKKTLNLVKITICDGPLCQETIVLLSYEHTAYPLPEFDELNPPLEPVDPAFPPEEPDEPECPDEVTEGPFQPL